MILYLNTSDLNKVTFKLLKGKTVVAEQVVTLAHHQVNDTLKHLQSFLRKHGVVPSISKAKSSGTKKLSTKHFALSTIHLFSGSGSYTGLRVGVAIAQALSLAWSIPLKTRKDLLV